MEQLCTTLRPSRFHLAQTIALQSIRARLPLTKEHIRCYCASKTYAIYSRQTNTNVYVRLPKIFFYSLCTLFLFLVNKSASYKTNWKYVMKGEIAGRNIFLNNINLSKCTFIRYLLLRHALGSLICMWSSTCAIEFGLRLYWTAPTVPAREMCVIKVDRLYTRKRAFPSKASLCNRTKFRIERADTHLTAFWTSNYSVCLSRTIRYCNPIYMNNKSV